MPGPVEHRTVTPLIKLIRDLARGRELVVANRYADEQAERTQPPPNIPEGPYHKTSEIYYYTHDARREVQPPMQVKESKQIGTEDKLAAEESFTPGKVYKWDS